MALWFCSVTVSVTALHPLARIEAADKSSSFSPIPWRWNSGRTHTWVTWPTLALTREHNSRPNSLYRRLGYRVQHRFDAMLWEKRWH